MVVIFNHEAGKLRSAGEYSELAAQAVKAQQFDAALDIYASWFDAEPSFFHNPKAAGASAVTHIRNAANLARKALFDKVQCVSVASSRIDLALRYYFGLQPKRFEQPLQQPVFFYIPDLPAQPFYQVEDIPGLTDLLDQLSRFKPDLLKLVHNSYQQYVDTVGSVPDTAEWQQIRQKWLSTHLLKGDAKVELSDSALQQCQQVLQHQAVAHCPPHGAEAFVSSLLPGAEIPPHYGVSNVKLTVHLPLSINAASSLQAGDQQFFWSEQTAAIVFDDSFLHSAANHGTARRDVLIFDVWHPALTTAEKQAICHFMAEHQRWSENYAKLAGLDAGL